MLLTFINIILCDGMIVINPSNKKRKCVGHGDNTLAFTDTGERAQYIIPREIGMIPPEGSNTAFSPSEEEWQPSILNNGRLTAFIPGNPGAGKSYLANELINLLPPDYQVLLFTAVDEDDGNFAELGDRLHKIRLEPENLSRMTLSTIRSVCPHPILLFDDIDKIRDKQIEKLVFTILEDALANGRDHTKNGDDDKSGERDIHVIVTSHSLNDYRKTKYTLENSDYVAVFPQSTTYMQMRRLFDKLGLERGLCDRVIASGKTGGIRRVIIHKVAPMYIIIGDEITLL